MKLSLLIALASIAVLPGSTPAKANPASSGPASFTYILQADSFAKSKSAAVTRLKACDRDWIILDASFDGEMPWAQTDLDSIRSGKAGRKVISYISIGEAEDYRPYWHKEWSKKGKLTSSAPGWLGQENPEWKGNYRVKYWNSEWQKIILASIDDAMAHGFDGVYLDIIDAFETFETDGKQYVPNRMNPETSQTYRRDMVDWVKTIASRARTNAPNALIIPQNGSELLEHPDFLQAISGVGIEDLFTDGDKLQAQSHTNDVLGNLKALAGQNKPALVIEYPKSAKRKALAKKLATQNGLVWLVTDRQLKTLGVSGQ